jgi:hypothetical protein
MLRRTVFGSLLFAHFCCSRLWAVWIEICAGRPSVESVFAIQGKLPRVTAVTVSIYLGKAAQAYCQAAKLGARSDHGPG